MTTLIFNDTAINNITNIDSILINLKNEIIRNYKLIHKYTIINSFQETILVDLKIKIHENYVKYYNSKPGISNISIIDSSPEYKYINNFINISSLNIKNINDTINVIKNINDFTTNSIENINKVDTEIEEKIKNIKEKIKEKIENNQIIINDIEIIIKKDNDNNKLDTEIEEKLLNYYNELSTYNRNVQKNDNNNNTYFEFEELLDIFSENTTTFNSFKIWVTELLARLNAKNSDIVDLINAENFNIAIDFQTCTNIYEATIKLTEFETILNNIKKEKENANKEQIKQAEKKAEASSFLQNLLSVSIEQIDHVLRKQKATENVNDFTKLANTTIGNIFDHMNTIKNINDFAKVATKNIGNVVDHAKTIQQIHDFTKSATNAFVHIDDSEIDIIIGKITEKHAKLDEEFKATLNKYEEINTEFSNNFDVDENDETKKKAFNEKKEEFNKKYKEFNKKYEAFKEDHTKFLTKKKNYENKRQTFYGGAEEETEEKDKAYFQNYLNNLNQIVVDDNVFLETMSEYLKKQSITNFVGNVLNTATTNRSKYINTKQNIDNFTEVATKNIENVVDTAKNIHQIHHFTESATNNISNVVDHVNTIQTIDNLVEYSIDAFSDNEIRIIIEQIDKKHKEFETKFVENQRKNEEIEKKIKVIKTLNNNDKKYTDIIQKYEKYTSAYKEKEAEYNEEKNKYLEMKANYEEKKSGLNSSDEHSQIFVGDEIDEHTITGGSKNKESEDFFKEHLKYLNAFKIEESGQPDFDELQNDLLKELDEILEEIQKKNIQQITDSIDGFQNASIQRIKSVCENPVERELNEFLDVASSNISQINEIIQIQWKTEHINHFERVAMQSFTDILSEFYLNKIAENVFEMFITLKNKYKLTDVFRLVNKNQDILNQQQDFIEVIYTKLGVKYEPHSKDIQTYLKYLQKEDSKKEDLKKEDSKKEDLKKKILEEIKKEIQANITQSIKNINNIKNVNNNKYNQKQLDSFKKIAIDNLSFVAKYQETENKKKEDYRKDVEKQMDNFQKIAITKIKDIKQSRIFAAKNAAKNTVKTLGKNFTMDNMNKLNEKYINNKINELLIQPKSTKDIITKQIDNFKNNAIKKIREIKSPPPKQNILTKLKNIKNPLNIKNPFKDIKNPFKNGYKELVDEEPERLGGAPSNVNYNDIQKLYSESSDLLQKIKEKYGETFYLSDDMEKNFNLIKAFYTNINTNMLNAENQELFQKYLEKINKNQSKTKSSFKGGANTDKDELNRLFTELLKIEIYRIQYRLSIHKFLKDYDTNGIVKFFNKDRISKLVSDQPQKISFTDANQYPNNYLGKMNELVQKMKSTTSATSSIDQFPKAAIRRLHEMNSNVQNIQNIDRFVNTSIDHISSIDKNITNTQLSEKFNTFPKAAIRQLHEMNSNVQNIQNIDRFVNTSIDHISDVTDALKYKKKLTQQNIDAFIQTAIYYFNELVTLSSSTTTTTTTTTNTSSTSTSPVSSNLNNSQNINSPRSTSPAFALDPEIEDKSMIQIESEISKDNIKDKQEPYNVFFNPKTEKITIYKGNNEIKAQ
jgi:hypothetical protein